MKCLLIIHLLILLFFCSCSEFKPDPIENFIPGTYIRFSRHEFGTEYDTLVITEQNASANEYKILRKWKYQRVEYPEYKKQTTSGVYNSKHKFLQDNAGDIYSFDVKEKLLFNGLTQYRKL